MLAFIFIPHQKVGKKTLYNCVSTCNLMYAMKKLGLAMSYSKFEVPYKEN